MCARDRRCLLVIIVLLWLATSCAITTIVMIRTRARTRTHTIREMIVENRSFFFYMNVFVFDDLPVEKANGIFIVVSAIKIHLNCLCLTIITYSLIWGLTKT